MSNRLLPLFISNVPLELSRVIKIDKAAAVRLGFRAISIDLDPKATAEAIERLRHG